MLALNRVNGGRACLVHAMYACADAHHRAGKGHRARGKGHVYGSIEPRAAS